jgi:hypothetical protein
MADCTQVRSDALVAKRGVVKERYKAEELCLTHWEGSQTVSCTEGEVAALS